MARVIYASEPLLLWNHKKETWRVAAAFTATWKGRTITVHRDFETDLASIPRIFLSLIGGKNRRHLQAAIVHDLCYKARFKGWPRKDVDRMFLDGMETLGVSWIRRKLIYRAVRIGGMWAWGG